MRYGGSDGLLKLIVENCVEGKYSRRRLRMKYTQKNNKGSKV